MNNPKTVLLVEDDENDQYFFTEALKFVDNATLFGVAKNGRDALQKMEDASTLPDMIFSDIHMPVMDGIECLTQIKRKAEIKHIPVVVLSSDTHQMDTVRHLGASGFIKKSNDWTDLKGKLKTALGTDFSHEKVANEVFLIL